MKKYIKLISNNGHWKIKENCEDSADFLFCLSDVLIQSAILCGYNKTNFLKTMGDCFDTIKKIKSDE